MRVYGVDFTCAPRKAKPITIASGSLKENIFRLEEVERLFTFADFEAFLERRGPWIGGFDLPFSLPRELVRDLKWPQTWRELVQHCASLTRDDLRKAFDRYRASRPVGSKYVHRATDSPAGSSSPMKLVNPPVALMFHEGAPRLLAAGVHLPALCAGDRARVALEAYPGLLVRKQLGLRASYKSDTKRDQTPARRSVRRHVLDALLAGRPLGIRLSLSHSLKTDLLADGSADRLDAAICAVQAAWAWQRRRSDFGLPRRRDPLEGWIVSVQPDAGAFSRGSSR
ncbi:MAG: DUF429 domain-containing protein [Clostridia bacterium]